MTFWLPSSSPLFKLPYHLCLRPTPTLQLDRPTFKITLIIAASSYFTAVCQAALCSNHLLPSLFWIINVGTQMLEQFLKGHFSWHTCSVCKIKSIIIIVIIIMIITTTTTNNNNNKLICMALSPLISNGGFQVTSKFYRGTQRQFSKNICSEDDWGSRIFRAFVVKFLACLPLLGFLNI